MTLKSHEEWKEIIVITDEDGNDYVVSCGWGVEPPVAYIPAASVWKDKTPAWLHHRRDEVVERLEMHKHIVEDEP